ncbi:hypothetical protein HIM_10564 [Hirsutella minnesotensis 3608]|uniref:DUF6570 domain-containing protein n=1 Tax=Hirsutella minnesotensis 3608 TaxID=1043627 RepID=A0A0F7ZG02_9HYPO|nr:hypothetical protein HIM_10564 [Hirsutella minnesotensis 3608]
MFPEELKGLTPVEEKLIALNSCYGFIAMYSIPGSGKQTAKYPKHVKGHITVFPNNVKELATKVLPHPLLQVMDEIRVSWQGPEKPSPTDVAGLLSVRRLVVEKAMGWLRANNPHYADIVINVAEMDSWGTATHGVPSAVYHRMERNEPSAWEKTRTAQVVPPSERAMDDGGPVEIEELFDMLNQERQTPGDRPCAESANDGDGARVQDREAANQAGDLINEVTSSAMFALDGRPDADGDKLNFALEAVGEDACRGSGAGARAWVGSSAKRYGDDGGAPEPYIHISRGDDFADSLFSC